jgi:sugar phosphate isomerase/epimerase
MAIKLGINTDNWRLENKGVDFCIRRTAELGVKWIEFNVLTGWDFFEGQQFSPAVSLDGDPYAIRDKLQQHGLQCSCLDAHYPLWSHHCMDYMTKAVIFADQIGCDAIATTDSEHLPAHHTHEEWLQIYKYHFEVVLEAAERHGINVCVEPHGVLTNQPDTLLQIVEQNGSERMRINFDTGNTFIMGHDPAAFLKQCVGRVHHLHIKDVSAELAAAARGGSTGIAASPVAIGDGVNADNIRACVDILKQHRFDGVCALECTGDALTQKSVGWFSGLIS